MKKLRVFVAGLFFISMFGSYPIRADNLPPSDSPNAYSPEIAASSKKTISETSSQEVSGCADSLSCLEDSAKTLKESGFDLAEEPAFAEIPDFDLDEVLKNSKSLEEILEMAKNRVSFLEKELEKHARVLTKTDAEEGLIVSYQNQFREIHAIGNLENDILEFEEILKTSKGAPAKSKLKKGRETKALLEEEMRIYSHALEKSGAEKESKKHFEQDFKRINRFDLLEKKIQFLKKLSG